MAAAGVVAVPGPVDGLGGLGILLLARALLSGEGRIGIGDVVGPLQQSEGRRDRVIASASVAAATTARSAPVMPRQMVRIRFIGERSMLRSHERGQ